MRAILLPLFLLAGCGPQKADKATLAKVEAQQQQGATEETVACALPGQPMRRGCVVERTQGSDGGLILTVRHPDGGFRRLTVTRDGRGVAAADGAEPATFSVIRPNLIEVTVAGEKYQLPATIKGGGGTK